MPDTQTFLVGDLKGRATKPDSLVCHHSPLIEVVCSGCEWFRDFLKYFILALEYLLAKLVIIGTHGFEQTPDIQSHAMEGLV